MLRIGIIGCGGFAGLHGKAIAEMADASVVALCDVNEDITRGFAERNLQAQDSAVEVFHFTSTKEFFAEGNLDAAVITSPHTMHFQHACEALEAGCHVLVEKPMVTDSAQARELKERVDQAGKILVIGYNTACSPEFTFIREAIRDQRYGPLEMVTGFLSQNWKKATVGKWRQDPALSGGGQAYDSGAHLFNSLVWSVESPIEEVCSQIDFMDTAVDINSVTNIKFQNGVLAAITVSGNSNSTAGYTAFIFEDGIIETDGWFSGWIKIQHKNKPVKYPHIPYEPLTPMQNFVRSIQGQDTPRTGPINGVHQAELMDAVYASAKLGRPVKASEIKEGKVTA
ncbi:MAG: Gfo/Idh/MocA family protein [Opitutales bacterium]